MADLSAAQSFAKECAGLGFGAILADPPWQFSNRTGKVAPEHRRLSRYETLTLDDIKEIPVSTAAALRQEGGAAPGRRCGVGQCSCIPVNNAAAVPRATGR